MGPFRRFAIIVLGTLALGNAPAGSPESAGEQQSLQLSPSLLTLLRSEMQALLTGIQELSAGIATGDWENVEKTGSRIHESYILKQKITRAQREELAHSLPDHFKRLDAAFHQEAKKLKTAAARRDAQLAAFHYYRLIEACTTCHASYAAPRFPGFSTTQKHDHHH